MDKIVWNQDLVPERIRLNARIATILKVLSPFWLLSFASVSTVIWRAGDTTVATMFLVAGCAILLVIVAVVRAWCVLMLRSLRKLPVIEVTSNQLRIGSEVVNRAQIIRVEQGLRGQRDTHLRIYLQDGSTRWLAIPRAVSRDRVRSMLTSTP